MKGEAIRAELEDAGLLVFKDGDGLRVRTAAADPVAFYDLCEDGAFRFGWVERADGSGRIDCLSWVDFRAALEVVKAA